MIQGMLRSLEVSGRYKLMARVPDTWDRQTMVMLYYDDRTIGDIKRYLSHRRPNSHVDGYGYEIDGYVNLGYNEWENDPANRNVRIVYCDMRIMTPAQVDDRFPNSYIIRVERREDDDTRRIGREIPQIPCN